MVLEVSLVVVGEFDILRVKRLGNSEWWFFAPRLGVLLEPSQRLGSACEAHRCPRDTLALKVENLKHSFPFLPSSGARASINPVADVFSLSGFVVFRKVLRVRVRVLRQKK